jgi:hypothetical protein
VAVPIIGNAGVIADVDENRNLQTFESIPGYPAAGGFYSVAGHTTAVVAAALAADVMLMSARLAIGSARKAYITRIRLHLWAVTANAAAVDQGILGVRRFTAQTPTGGNARTANRFAEAKGTVTDITDIRDSNAALTGTAPTWGNIVAQVPVPVVQGAVAAGLAAVFAPEYVLEFPAPLELVAGDGIALRTIKACPATATWGYSYTIYWYER